jgi:hypothetical protein
MKNRVISGVKQQMWGNESGLAILFILLLVVDFILIPVYSDDRVVRLVVKLFWALFLFTGIQVIAKDKKRAMLLYAIPVLQIIAGAVDVASDNALIALINAFLRMACFLLLIALVLTRIFQPGPVTVYRIVGSVAVFILLANFFAETYFVIYNNDHGAFNLPANGFHEKNPFPSFLYFSFITITTTGYGDVLPVLPQARSVVQIEALTGVLYPTILISRLVSGSIESSKKS